MLRWRLLSSFVAIALLVLLCWLDFHASTPGVWLLPLACVVALLASGEVLALLAARELRPLAWVVYGGNLLVVVSNYAGLWWPEPLGRLGWPMLAMTLVVTMAFVGEMARYERPGGVTERLAVAIFGVAYVGLLLSFVVQLRLLDAGTSGERSPLGMAALLSLIVVVKLSDTGAYFSGKLFGRHKMSPRLSPGKTIEGGVGGLLFALLGGWITAHVLIPAMIGSDNTASSLPRGGWAAYGLLVGLAGMAGDLAESLLKRDLGRKDSSTWLPGLGGVLDLLDSILFAAPAAYLCWMLGLVGP